MSRTLSECFQFIHRLLDCQRNELGLDGSGQFRLAERRVPARHFSYGHPLRRRDADSCSRHGNL